MKLVKIFSACAAIVAMMGTLVAVEPRDVAGKQIEWCMIGDSITWAGNGDCFRKELLALIPELAFVGTHTAKFGYSHAGEGGNTRGIVGRREPWGQGNWAESTGPELVLTSRPP